MIYVAGGLYGRYDKYIQLLEKIDLKDADNLYLLGNLCGPGPDSCKILKDAMMRINIFPIMGKNDLRALRLLFLMNNEEAKADPEYRKAFAAWLSEGGVPMVTEFRALSEEEQQDILSYMEEEFVAYDEVTVNGKSYVLVHAGLGNYRKDRSLDDYTPEELVDTPADFSHEYFEDRFLITAGTPTHEIDEKAKGFIYRRNGQIGIDTGAGEGGPLACLCLDNDAEVYV